MKTVKRCIRPTGAVLLAFLVVSVAVATHPAEAAAQGRGLGMKHDWTPPGPPWKKHDALPPYGPPCGKEGRPCPPGNAYGLHKDEAVSLEFSGVFTDLVTAVGEGTMETPHPVPALAQHALYRVWSEGESAEVTDLALALASRGNANAWNEAVALVEALQWLPYSAAQLPAATEAFNAYLDASTDSFLRDPAPEFLVVHGFLGTLVEEALKAPEGG